ncbi:sigma factor-like helix-turn-helix DNA-binding protein [Paenibacillus oralis]|nr:sigma factor-like helix-turn-helix DNA-binding protein [Paenibacillus oralis]
MLTPVNGGVGAADADDGKRKNAKAKIKDNTGPSVLILFYLEGKSYRDICQELNLSEAVLSQRLVRARKKLLQHFLGKWVDYDERA